MDIQLQKPKLLLSTDTLAGYGLDLIFSFAKRLGFDGIDLAIWKTFDAWSVEYINDLIQRYEMPVHVVQVSSKVNLKEMNKAIELAIELGVKTIVINPPKFIDLKTENFIKSDLKNYKKLNPKIVFAGTNAYYENIGIVPIPQNRMTNPTEIVKKYGLQLGLDIVNLEENVMELEITRKIANYLPYIEVVYIADKKRGDKNHIPLGEGSIKLDSFFKKCKQNEYDKYFSIKLDLPKKDLADLERIEMMVQKSIHYYKEKFENLTIGK